MYILDRSSRPRSRNLKGMWSEAALPDMTDITVLHPQRKVGREESQRMPNQTCRFTTAMGRSGRNLDRGRGQRLEGLPSSGLARRRKKAAKRSPIYHHRSRRSCESCQSHHGRRRSCWSGWHDVEHFDVHDNELFIDMSISIVTCPNFWWCVSPMLVCILPTSRKRAPGSASVAEARHVFVARTSSASNYHVTTTRHRLMLTAYDQ